MPICCQRSSILGSFCGRFAFMGKSVVGRLTVAFRSTRVFISDPQGILHYKLSEAGKRQGAIAPDNLNRRKMSLSKCGARVVPARQKRAHGGLQGNGAAHAVSEIFLHHRDCTRSGGKAVVWRELEPAAALAVVAR